MDLSATEFPGRVLHPFQFSLDFSQLQIPPPSASLGARPSVSAKHARDDNKAAARLRRIDRILVGSGDLLQHWVQYQQMLEQRVMVDQQQRTRVSAQ